MWTQDPVTRDGHYWFRKFKDSSGSVFVACRINGDAVPHNYERWHEPIAEPPADDAPATPATPTRTVKVRAVVCIGLDGHSGGQRVFIEGWSGADDASLIEVGKDALAENYGCDDVRVAAFIEAEVPDPFAVDVPTVQATVTSKEKP